MDECYRSLILNVIGIGMRNHSTRIKPIHIPQKQRKPNDLQLIRGSGDFYSNKWIFLAAYTIHILCSYSYLANIDDIDILGHWQQDDEHVDEDDRRPCINK